MAKKQETDHVEEMKAATARASRPKETAEERNARRLATANALRMRAEFDILAARAAAAKMPRKIVTALRHVVDVHAAFGGFDIETCLETAQIFVARETGGSP
jgi:hypothetical protein